QLLKEAAPAISRVATLKIGGGITAWFEKSGAPAREIDAAGKGLGLTLVPIVVQGPDNFADAFAALARAGRADALLVESGGPAYVHRRLIFESAAKQRLPAVYPGRE